MTSASIVDALFTKSQQRVLGLLYGNPDERFYTNEIIRRAAMGRGAVRRELERLTAAGLLLKHPAGNQQYYQANPGSPVFVELHGLVSKTIGLAEVLREALQPLAEDIQAAFVYGAAAGGDEPEGVIDVMIVGRVSLEAVIAALSPCQLALGREIEPTLMSPEEYQQAMSVEYSSFAEVMGQPKQTILGKAEAFKALGLER